MLREPPISQNSPEFAFRKAVGCETAALLAGIKGMAYPRATRGGAKRVKTGAILAISPSNG